MAQKSLSADFEQTMDLLRAHSFDVSPLSTSRRRDAGVEIWSRRGAGSGPWRRADVRPGKRGGETVRGGVCHCSRGPCSRGSVSPAGPRATRSSLGLPNLSYRRRQANCKQSTQFSEELNQLTGSISLYNKALGTTSDLYLYDGLRNREGEQPQASAPLGSGRRTLAFPLILAEGHNLGAMDMKEEVEPLAAPASNRRSHPRYAVDELASLNVFRHEATIPCHVVDLSLTGCRLRAVEPFLPAFALVSKSASKSRGPHSSGSVAKRNGTDDCRTVGIPTL